MLRSRSSALVVFAPLLLSLAACEAEPPQVIQSALRWQSQSFPTGTRASLRGLVVVDEHTVFASGSGSTVLRTVDGGRNWERLPPPPGPERDFRDLHAADVDHIWLMAAGPGDASSVWYTADGGRHWAEQLRNPDAAGFFDAMDFWDPDHGLLMGDPLEGRLTLFTTDNGGRDWRRLAAESCPSMQEGEYAFAASGSCLVTIGDRDAWIVTGGSRARVLHSPDRGRSWIPTPTPIRHGKASTGLFGIGFAPTGKLAMAVGGDYQSPTLGGYNLLRSAEPELSWIAPTPGLAGFRSAIACLDSQAKVWIAVGSHGADWSSDGGQHWKNLPLTGYHAIASDGRRQAWAVGTAESPPLHFEWSQ